MFGKGGLQGSQPYVEWRLADGVKQSQKARCDQKNIQGFPSWESNGAAWDSGVQAPGFGWLS